VPDISDAPDLSDASGLHKAADDAATAPPPQQMSKRGKDDWSPRLYRCRAEKCIGCPICNGRFHHG